MTRTVFEKVKLVVNKRVNCAAGCGRDVRRTKTFWMTLNPWNKDPETGEPRTYLQARWALEAEASAWRLLPEWCRKDDQP